jgi:uncharacterized iron-regulated membrane protein
MDIRGKNFGNSFSIRRLHTWIGILGGMNLLLIVSTGLLIQHRDIFGLESRYVSRRFLPSGYRPTDGGEVRSDIVVTDLHSGRILGATGAGILDAVTVGWFVLFMTGVRMYLKRANSSGNPISEACRLQTTSSRKTRKAGGRDETF